MNKPSVSSSETKCRLRYGRASTVEIEPAASATFWHGAPDGASDNAGQHISPIDDPAAAVAAALDDPLEYPPLKSAVAPGDRVVIALAAQVPQAEAIVAGVIHALLSGDSGCQSIEVVYESSAEMPTDVVGGESEDPLKLVPANFRSRVSASRHDPADRGAMAYLAASREARPIYFNRKLLDADLVVPVGLARPSRFRFGQSTLFPAFSDRETQVRFSEAGPGASKLDKETDEAIWLLGAQFLLQATPGPGDSLLQVHAGERHAVTTKATSLCDAVWEYQAPRRFDLVIAAIDGGPAQQTWRSFSQALAGALEVVSPQGAIVICSEIEAPPGPPLKLLAHPRGREAGLKAIRKLHSFDVEPARILFEALDRARVYFLSRLPQETVEDLGMAHVSEPNEIAHLTRSAASCALLSSAQHVAVTVAD